MAAIDIAIVTKGTNQTYSAGGSTIGGASSVNRLLSVSEVDANFINLKQGVVNLEYTASTTYAPLSSPALTGTGGNPATYSRTIPTGTSTFEIATTSFVQQELGPTATIVSDINVGNQALNTKISLKANLNGPTTFTGAVRLTGANNGTLAGDPQRIVNTGYVDYKLQNIDVNLLPTTGGQVNIGTSSNYINQIHVKQILPAGSNTSIGTASNPFDEGYFANNTIFIGSAGLSQGAAGGIVLPEGSAFGDEDSTIPRNLISTELDKAFGDLTSGPKKAIKLTLVASGGISSGNAIILNSNGTVSAISTTNTSFIGFAATSATNGNNVDIIVAGPVTGLSGLLTNSEVLVSSTGTFKFSRTLPSDIKVGTATSTTELFLYSTSTMDVYALAKAKAELADFSVNTASAGSNGLTYNSSTGIFNFTPVDLTTFATQSYVDTEIANLVNSAPTSLDTLDELAAALNDDANFASTVTNSIGTKAPLASPALTGTPTAPTASSSTNTTQIATTAFVQTEITDKIEFTNLSVSTASASSGGALSYNNATGQFTFTPADLSGAGNASLNSFSVTTNTPSGSGALSYNNSTGAFSFTPPDLSTYSTFDGAFSSLTGKPTTISGYGITDAFSGAFSSLTGKPTTISGYGITDAFDGAYGSLSGTPSTLAHTNADIDIGSNDFITTGKVLFANMYSALGDLPSASTYHGMFAHVHGTGGAYFAHGGNWIELANKSYVDTQVASVVDSAPGTLDTLNELAAALGDDSNFSTTVTNSIAAKAPLASPALTGVPTSPTAASGTNTTQLATTAFVTAAVAAGGGGGGGGASVTTSDAAPSSPSAGDLWYNTSTGGLFVYYTDANSSQWVEVVGKTGATGATGVSAVSISDAAPSSPSAGDLWWNSSVNKLYIYYTDANSSQWVQATTPGADGTDGTDGTDGSSAAITRYANVAGFPGSPTAADLAYANDTNTVYIYDGSSWDRISSGNDESPFIITEPPSSHELNSDGSNSSFTIVAQDPEGFDITYGIAYNTTNNILPDQLTSAPTIDQANGVFTFSPSANTSDAGTFKARISASDGAKTTTRFVNVELAFIPQEANIIGWYDFSDTNSYNSAVSTTALNDISGNGNNQTISGPGAFDTNTNTLTLGTINFGGNLSATKAWMVLYYPETGYDHHLMWDNASADSTWYGMFNTGHTGAVYSGYSLWSGATFNHRVNGVDVHNTGTSALDTLTLNSFNTVISSGINMGTGAMKYNTYPLNWAKAHKVRAFVFWDVELSVADMQQMHNYYRPIIGASNMPAWGN